MRQIHLPAIAVGAKTSLQVIAQASDRLGDGGSDHAPLAMDAKPSVPADPWRAVRYGNAEAGRAAINAPAIFTAVQKWH